LLCYVYEYSTRSCSCQIKLLFVVIFILARSPWSFCVYSAPLDNHTQQYHHHHRPPSSTTTITLSGGTIILLCRLNNLGNTRKKQIRSSSITQHLKDRPYSNPLNISTQCQEFGGAQLLSLRKAR
jgi:hypothetical protein